MTPLFADDIALFVSRRPWSFLHRNQTESSHYSRPYLRRSTCNYDPLAQSSRYVPYVPKQVLLIAVERLLGWNGR